MRVEKGECEMIKDSGNRREFDSGAVRDIQEGKGRCDLLPLKVIGLMYDRKFDTEYDNVFFSISNFQKNGDIQFLLDALDSFYNVSYFDSYQDMILEVSKHFEEGAKKYSERNWEKGIPIHCYIDSAVRHYLKFLRGDTDERHDRAFCWNILCCIWTCINKPELNDYLKADDDEN